MLAYGYSKPTITRNIRIEYHRGTPLDQAVAIALRTARAAWREKHPRAKLPRYLRAQ